MARTPSTLVRGQTFTEALRWHGGLLWFVDFHLGEIATVDLSGAKRVVARMEGDRPSGMGWLPDGTLLVVAMDARRVMRLDASGFHVHADLSSIATHECNDMLVTSSGRAYAGNMGSRLVARVDENHRYVVTTPPAPARLALVAADGEARAASDEPLVFPNGMCLTPDGATLIIAETFARRITAFSVRDDGTLHERRVFAEIDGMPDGIALDAEGAVWYSDIERRGCFRVLEGGRVVDEVLTGRPCYCCALGGPEGRHLFLSTSLRMVDPDEARALRQAAIEVVEVDVPAALTR